MYSSLNVIRVIKSRGGIEACSIHGDMIHAYKILARKYQENRPLRRPMHRGEKNIKMGLKEIGYEDVDWM